MPPTVTDYWILVRLIAHEHEWLHAEAARWRTTCGRVGEWAIRRRALRPRTLRERLLERGDYYLLVGLRPHDRLWLLTEARLLRSPTGRVLEQALRAERVRTLTVLGSPRR